MRFCRSTVQKIRHQIHSDWIRECGSESIWRRDFKDHSARRSQHLKGLFISFTIAGEDLDQAAQKGQISGMAQHGVSAVAMHGRDMIEFLPRFDLRHAEGHGIENVGPFPVGTRSN